ncbi:hypothetical protein H2O64_21615 [Kordia sp. YSTF-M3]|uniref:Uncharacterized protein n=1 Tax=Kordia aestuariivivens TaxID=2759037 RepID=A0ABR7QFU4_9FLAO|nr:hypothetical protein [Kordia aestuariivivens]MBC8757283.1 hypothetical protein [Kordia aestuariivivens]
MNNKENHIISCVRNILNNDWDPLNATYISTAEDEYDRYLSLLIKLINKKESESKIIRLLKKIEKKELGGISSTAEQLNIVAKKLHQLKMN